MFMFPLNISAVISDLMMAMLFVVSEFMTYNVAILPLKVGSREDLSFFRELTFFGFKLVFKQT
jgi:hypothetical protein